MRANVGMFDLILKDCLVDSGLRSSHSGITCPECGTSFVEYLKDAETGDIVRPEDRRLIVCMVCRHIFPVFADESPSIMRDADGTPIEGDRKCPGCGYNLRTLKIGARCPECAWRIRPEVTWSRPEGDGPWTHWDTIVAIVWSLAFVAMVIVGSVAKVPSAVFWGALGLLFVANGCRGLATGRVMIISRSIFQRTAKGRWGFVVSVLYVVLGLAMGTLSAALHFHWI